MPIVVTPDDQPVEIGPGRGDLRRTSIPFDEFLANGPFYRGRPISYARIFQTQPWIAIAVMRLLTWSVRVPLKAYRRVDDDAKVPVRPDEHPLAAALARPWERAPQAQLTMGMLGPLSIHGNALLDVDEGRAGKLRFERLDWRMVQPVTFDNEDPTAEIQSWKYRQGKTVSQRSADTVMHLKWWSPLGEVGISPLEQIRSTVLSEEAAIAWGVNSLAQGIKPNGVVTLDKEFLGLEAGERQALLNQAREDMADAYSGPGNAGSVPVLPPGLQWADAKQTTAVEAQLVQQRVVNRNEVAAIYMIPPPMIGQLDKASFSNITTQREMAYTDGLAPPLILAEQTMNAHVVQGLLREKDLLVEYDFGHILRGDRLKEIQALREAISSALMTPDEGRDVLNLKQHGGDAGKLWLQQNNLKPLNTDDESEPAERETEKETA